MDLNRLLSQAISFAVLVRTSMTQPLKPKAGKSLIQKFIKY